MSFITKDKSGAWRARYRDPAGRARSKNFARKADAAAFLTSVDHGKLAGAYVDPAAGRVTFGEYAEQWRAVQVHRASTALMVETHLRRHVLPFLGHRPLASIRQSELRAWAKARSEVLEPATVEVVYRYVVAIFRAAVRDRVIASSPAVGIRMPKSEPRRVEPFPVETVQALIESVPDRYRALVVCAADTGMRQGECFGLTADLSVAAIPDDTDRGFLMPSAKFVWDRIRSGATPQPPPIQCTVSLKSMSRPGMRKSSTASRPAYLAFWNSYACGATSRS